MGVSVTAALIDLLEKMREISARKVAQKKRSTRFLSLDALQHPDGEAVGLQRRDQLAHVVAVARLDGDVEVGGLGDHAAEQALVLDLDDVAAGLADDGGDAGELARARR